jgi:hypothetical protein
MCSVPSQHNIPIRSTGREVGALRLDRSNETAALIPYRAPAVRISGGRVIAGGETIAEGSFGLGGSNGTTG